MSAQFKDAITEYDVVLAYRVLLGRDPETMVLTTFGAEMQRRKMSRKELVQGIMQSDEFKDKYDLPRNVVMRSFGGYVVYMRPEDLDIGAVIAAGAEYEPHIVNVFNEYAKLGSTVLDVGANIGFFTMLAASLVGAGGRVIAVEPLDKNLQLIYLAATHNGYKHIEVLPFAAIDTTGIWAAHTTTRTSNAEVKQVDLAQKHELFTAVRPLDSVLRDLPSLDLVKIDVAGSEPIAFAGMSQTLDRLKPVVVTQFHPQAIERNTPYNAEDYAQMLCDYAPNVYALTAQNNRVRCENKEDVIRCWESHNQSAGLQGELYIDLLATPNT